MYIALLFACNLIVAILILYITQLDGQMRQTILQGLKLMNGMHEGLLIMSRTDQSILYAN